MIYLDNAATTLHKPDAVIHAVCGAITSLGNPSRGAHEPSLAGLRTLLVARGELSGYFGVGDPMRVAFAQNASMALNTAIASVNGPIVTTAAEHNSVLRPVFRRGAHTVVPVDAMGRLDLDELEAALLPGTAALVMTHASNVTGNVYDIRAAAELCRRRGVALIVDGAQSAGLLEVDVAGWGISAFCFSGHKSLYGPTGTGGLCLGAEFRPVPLVVGGSGSRSFDPIHPDTMPDALEAGTQNVHGIAGLLAGVRHVRALNGRAAEVANSLAARFVAGAREIPGVLLYGALDTPARAPVVSLNIARRDSAEVAAKLWERYAIAVRAGAHCAPLMHRALGTEVQGTVRFSFSHTNTPDEVDAAVDALREICKDGGKEYDSD